MVLDTTYTNKEHVNLINDLVGNPYTFFQSLKMKGVGSKRMVIDDVSPNMKTYTNTITDTNYANIELRPSGILIKINKGLKNVTWVIPYYQLVIYKTNGSSIHAQGRFVHFRNNKTFHENKAFFNKLMDKKMEYDSQYNFQEL